MIDVWFVLEASRRLEQEQARAAAQGRAVDDERRRAETVKADAVKADAVKAKIKVEAQRQRKAASRGSSTPAVGGRRIRTDL